MVDIERFCSLKVISLDVSISDDSIVSRQLFEICPNLKSLLINKNNSNRMTLSFQTLKNVATNCQQIESLEISNIQIREGGLEVPSTACYQLQVIYFIGMNVIGLNKLITMNHALTFLNVSNIRYGPSIGE